MRRFQLLSLISVFLLVSSTVLASAEDPQAVMAEQPESLTQPTNTQEVEVSTPPKLWRFSPEFLVAAPQPLLVGVEGVHSNWKDFRFYVDGGYFQFPISIETKGIRAYSLETGVRYQPFQNPLLLTLGMGYRKINFVTNFSPFTIDDVTMVTGGSLHLHTFYITPMIEGRFKISDRISIGCGIGAQIPILYTGNMDLENNTNGANSNTSDVLSVDSVLPMKRIAGIILPRITLFQLVWNLN